MQNGFARRLSIAACACVLAASIAGCGQGASSSATDEQQANRAYMSQVNETMVQLEESLDPFVDAVSRGDVVNMRTQADNAYKVLDKLEDIEAPEALADIREGYVEGAAKLREALDDYIDLYADAAADDLDRAEYDKRIASIQKLYDQGVKLLEDTDKAIAAEAAGDEGAASDEGASSDESASSESSSSASA